MNCMKEVVSSNSEQTVILLTGSALFEGWSVSRWQLELGTGMGVGAVGRCAHVIVGGFGRLSTGISSTNLEQSAEIQHTYSRCDWEIKHTTPRQRKERKVISFTHLQVLCTHPELPVLRITGEEANGCRQNSKVGCKVMVRERA